MPFETEYVDYAKAVMTTEGSIVGNYLLRELMEALDESQHARPQTPRQVWDEMLDEVRHLVERRTYCNENHNG